MSQTPQAQHDATERSRWSLVRRIRAASPAEARAALADLAHRYCYPVYLYIRRSGHPPEAAADATRRFFGGLATAAAGGNGAPGGRFRDWLLARLVAFLGTDWRDGPVRETPGDMPPLDELERRWRADPFRGGDPTQAYQRAFALEMLVRSTGRLRAEARETGHLDMYLALEPYLGRDPQPGEYDDLARMLDARPLAIVLALKRLRQRFRELAHEEMTDTVISPRDFAEEQRTLLTTLGGVD